MSCTMFLVLLKSAGAMWVHTVFVCVCVCVCFCSIYAHKCRFVCAFVCACTDGCCVRSEKRMVVSLSVCLSTCTLTHTDGCSSGWVFVRVRVKMGGVWSGVAASVFRACSLWGVCGRWKRGRMVLVVGGAALPQSRTVRWAGTKQLNGGGAWLAWPGQGT